MRGTRIRLAIALMLAGALASGAMAQAALAQETGTTGATGDENFAMAGRDAAQIRDLLARVTPE